MTRLTITNAQAKLAAEPVNRFTTMFQHGSLEVEYYQPEKIDLQTPHTRDEIYVVVSGSGEFICGEIQQPCETGEVLFAAAGVAHRFVNFTDDFAVWVFFYGPEGGESSD